MQECSRACPPVLEMASTSVDVPLSGFFVRSPSLKPNHYVRLWNSFLFLRDLLPLDRLPLVSLFRRNPHFAD